MSERKTYRAAVLPGAGQALEVREFLAPELQPGGVLLRTELSEVCGTDVHLAHGRLAGVPYPIIPGHVSAGRIQEMRGPVLDVQGRPFQEGERVAFLDVHETCGACSMCLVHRQSTRCPKRKVYGITYSASEGLLGGWAEMIWLKPGVRLLRLPESLPLEVFCGGGCGMPTALHAIERAQLRLEESVVVLGAGPVGQSLIALSRISGAGEVIAVDMAAQRLDFARRMGASRCLDLGLDEASRQMQVLEWTNGLGADVVLEASGNPAAVRQGLDLLRDGGRMVVVGQYTDNGPVKLNPHTQINRKHAQILGCWGSDFSHFFRAIQILARHHEHFPWSEMLTRSYGLEELNEALQAVEERRVVKAAVRPWN